MYNSVISVWFFEGDTTLGVLSFLCTTYLFNLLEVIYISFWGLDFFLCQRCHLHKLEDFATEIGVLSNPDIPPHVARMWKWFIQKSILLPSLFSIPWGRNVPFPDILDHPRSAVINSGVSGQKDVCLRVDLIDLVKFRVRDFGAEGEKSISPH